MDYRDYYKILGVERDVAQDEIKRAYRKLARKYHPDVSKEADAEERFKEVNRAYQVLSNPYEKARYDLRLKYGGRQPTHSYYQQPSQPSAPRRRPFIYAERIVNWKENW